MGSDAWLDARYAGIVPSVPADPKDADRYVESRKAPAAARAMQEVEYQFRTSADPEVRRELALELLSIAGHGRNAEVRAPAPAPVVVVLGDAPKSMAWLERQPVREVPAQMPTKAPPRPAEDDE